VGGEACGDERELCYASLGGVLLVHCAEAVGFATVREEGGGDGEGVEEVEGGDAGGRVAGNGGVRFNGGVRVNGGSIRDARLRVGKR